MKGLLTIAGLLLMGATLAACGGGTQYDASGKPAQEAEGGGGHGGHGAPASEDDAEGAEGGGQEGGHAGHSGGGDAGQAKAPVGADEMRGMRTLARSNAGDLSVELHAMAPERFFVAEGDGFRPQRPTKADDTHLMLTVADRKSGVRLPDATVTVRVSKAGGATAFEGPLYPMVGRGMGLHYGENVDLPGKGTYSLAVTVGPPRVGRHRAVAKAWSRTATVRQRLVYDGKQVRAK